MIAVFEHGRRRLARTRAGKLAVQSLPDLLELVARELRGGSDLHGALRAYATDDHPLSPGIGHVVSRVAQGARLGEALDGWIDELDHDDADLVLAVFQIGHSTGAALAAALDRTAATLRERAALADELRSLTAQSRMSAYVVGAAPLLFMVLAGSVDPAALRILVTTPVGWGCLIGGLALDALGLAWMHRLTAGVAS